MKRSTAMGVLSLFFTLLMLVDRSEQQYAWRPQGRFGKRMGNQVGQIPTGDGATLSGVLSQLGPFRSTVQYLDMPVFRSDGVVCITTGSQGNYKCFTFQSNDQTEETEKH